MVDICNMLTLEIDFESYPEKAIHPGKLLLAMKFLAASDRRDLCLTVWALSSFFFTLLVPVPSGKRLQSYGK